MELTWTLLGAAGAALRAAAVGHGRGPRHDGALAAGDRVGRATARAPPVRRSRSWRRSRAFPQDGLPAAPVAERHGSSALAGLVRRGLLRAEVRERPRRPLAHRPAADPRRPPGGRLADRGPGRGAAARPGRMAAGDPRRSCSTGSPAAARPRSTWRPSPPSLAAGRPALSWSRRSRWPCRSWIGCGPTRGQGRRPAFGPGRG